MKEMNHQKLYQNDFQTKIFILVFDIKLDLMEKCIYLALFKSLPEAMEYISQELASIFFNSSYYFATS